MHQDGTLAHQLAADLDRDISSVSWATDSQCLYAKFEDHGIGHVGLFGLNGHDTVPASGLGGAFAVSDDVTIAYAGQKVDRPNELLLQIPNATAETLTSLIRSCNSDSLGSSFTWSRTQRVIEGWALLPPGSSGVQEFPMILVLHGGPFGDDGPTWDSQRELFAAAGYEVVYGTTADRSPTEQPFRSRRTMVFLEWRTALP